MNNPPSGWTTQTQLDKLIIANDNIKGAEPIEVSILMGAAIQDKPDIAFRKSWQKYFGLADTATVPRGRKLYNTDGITMHQAAMEMTLNNEKHYYVFTMYYDEKYTQCIVIRANSLKAYKPQQAEWLDRLQRVSFLKK
ncbi:MAG TPA: hypothetical protein VLC98_16245 [Phnomibacter sp.]|nr:hypothetical protein [Phnomibacter sp.]